MRAPRRRGDELYRAVRELALEQQTGQPQVFLPLRETAGLFKVPVSAMAEVYRRLSKERILSTVRGSRTMLRPKEPGRTSKVHGIIGLAVSQHQFLTLREYRDCFLRLRDEFFARGFLSRCLFFDGPAPDPAPLVRGFADAGVEAVVWIFPQAGSRETILRLRDRGIDFIGIGLAATAHLFCRYQVQRRKAVAAIFRNWRDEARIERATIIRARRESPADRERMERLEKLASAEQIECNSKTLGTSELHRAVTSLCGKEGRALVLPAPAASVLAWSEPEAVGAVLSACRVALVDGPLDVPLSSRHEAAADLVTVDWPPIARRVASDFGTAAAVDHNAEPVIFEAKPLLRVPLHGLVQDGKTPAT